MFFHKKTVDPIRVVLSWDFNINNKQTDAYDFDLDLSCILENTDTGEMDAVAIKLSKSNFNQNVIRIHRDNVTGFGDDDEMMDIDLSRIPDTFNKIAILVNVHKGEIRSTYFGKVPNTSISISKNGWQIYSCNITSRYAKYNAVVPAYFIRDKKSNKWKLKTKGTVLHGDSITQVLSSYKLVEKHIFKKVEG